MSRVILFVEGESDKRFIESLVGRCQPAIKANLSIQSLGGIDNLKSRDLLDKFSLAIKSDAQTVGLICDSDAALASRWAMIRTACSRRNLALPPTYPPDGFLTTGKDTRPFGCWIMPPNADSGCMETWILSAILEEEQLSLVEQARQFVTTVKPRKFADTRAALDKATLFAWMAVQEKPQDHAGKEAVWSQLPSFEASARPFLDWLEKLTLL